METEDSGWQLEIGLEEQLHIEFTSPQSRYALGEVIRGRVEFLVVNLPLLGAELSLVRREVVGDQITEQALLLRHQIIDGPPQKGDSIAFQLPLANLVDLTSSMRGVEKVTDLLYFINLIIYDCEGRRFFKQQEIQLYRADSHMANPLLLYK